MFPQPTEPTVAEPLEAVDSDCPTCGAAAVFAYRVVDYRGWLRVTKCRSCLHVLDSRRIRPPSRSGVA
ncbi:hypothetical protein ACFQ34_31345 [Pseudonocardia benzenivorans]|jgi:hypothetical protein|uniref:Uncharacterized protein n=1 Tax=Pseudonocardia benzenivorans TaxID=228005 RepID=A0ABW3VRK2_9PSEU|nr:hypothetical protein PSD17_49900 [Pseudonocardia sp. D17]